MHCLFHRPFDLCQLLVSPIGIVVALPLTQCSKPSWLSPFAQVFDVSNNSFTGPVPAFLYANNVPPWTQPTVYIQACRPMSTHPDHTFVNA